MKNLFLLCITFCTSVNVFGQLTFQKTFGGTSGEYGFSISKTFDGGTVICGDAFASQSLNDVLVVKLNSAGNIDWAKTLGGINNEKGSQVIQTADSGFVIIGSTLSFSSTDYNIFLNKLDAAGTTVWSKRIEGPIGYLYGIRVLQTTDKGLVLTGYFHNSLGSQEDIFLIRCDSLGTPFWSKSYGGNGIEYGYAVRQLPDGGFIMAGYSQSFGADVYLIRTNTIGDTLWTRTYGGAGGEMAKSVETSSDGGLVIAGFTNSFGAGNQDALIFKVDSAGNLVWAKTYGTSLEESLTDIKRTGDGGYVAIGNIQNGFNQDSSDILMLKIDSQGNPEWTRRIGGPGGDLGSGIVQSDDAGYTLVGSTRSFGSGNFDLLVVKTDSLGYSGCNEGLITVSTSTPPLQVGSPATQMPNVGFTQFMVSGNTNSNLSVATLCLADGVNDLAHPRNIIALSPNPTSGRIRFTLQTKAESDVDCKIQVLNSVGQIVLSKELRLSDLIAEDGITFNTPGVYTIFIFTRENIYQAKAIVY